MTKSVNPNSPATPPSGDALPKSASVSTLQETRDGFPPDPYENERVKEDLGRPRELGESVIGLPFQARVEVDKSAALRARRELSYLLQAMPKP